MKSVAEKVEPVGERSGSAANEMTAGVVKAVGALAGLHDTSAEAAGRRDVTMDHRRARAPVEATLVEEKGDAGNGEKCIA